jgi:hypothetical protein
MCIQQTWVNSSAAPHWYQSYSQEKLLSNTKNSRLQKGHSDGKRHESAAFEVWRKENKEYVS